MKQTKALPTSERVAVENYPYGRLKTTAYFSIEFKSGKGFRSVFQTIDPKTGRLNNPKKGTYYPVLFLTKDENDFVKSECLDFYGADGINKDCQKMAEIFHLFTDEQIKDIYAHVFMKLKVEAKAAVVYCGADFEKLKPILQEPVNVTMDGFKSGENVFAQIKIDLEAYESCKQKDFNPFRKVETFVIS